VSPSSSILVACPDCDLLQRLGDIPEGSTARCPRCGGLLRKNPRNGLDRALALTYAAAILFVVANSFPFLSFEMKGEETQTTLATGIIDMYNQGKWEISLLVGFTIVLAPVAQIAMLAYLLTPIRLGRVPYALPLAFRILRHMLPWSMMEVFMIGILVAIPKLMGMASVIPGTALFAFVLLMLVLSGANAAFDPESVWRKHEAAK
jgi:paraquat-inducible protein A